MLELQLRVEDFDGPRSWRWVLSREGEFLADHQVVIPEPCWESDALQDLHGHLQWAGVTDISADSESEILTQIGHWAYTYGLGTVGQALVAQSVPVTVRLVTSAQTRHLALWPWELAIADSRTLASRDIRFVVDLDLQTPVRPRVEARPALRVLGLFSLPDDASPLNLRRERVALMNLFQEVSAVHRKAIDLRILQYGVTRKRLRDVVNDGQGWDILHVSAHGSTTGLLLEREDGSPDLVTSEDLRILLGPLAARVKFAMVSSCSSGASESDAFAARVDELRPVHRNTVSRPDRTSPSPSLAAALAAQLGCWVLGMRYPVDDRFAIELSHRVYNRLIGDAAQSPPQALAFALSEWQEESGRPTLAEMTPILFGCQGAEVRLTAPALTGPPLGATHSRQQAFLPSPPAEFVGRAGLLTAASKALAPRSGASGVVLHGMPRVGKSACALELAHTHADRFAAVVWHEVRGDEHVGTALQRFARELRKQLEDAGLTPIAHFDDPRTLDDPDLLARSLRLLSIFLTNNRVLVVLDHATPLLTEQGRWRDHRWGMLVDAVTGHSGLSRLVMTTSSAVPDLDDRVTRLPVVPLSTREAALLARSLPDTSALFGEGSRSRETIRSLLRACGGHPGLLMDASRDVLLDAGPPDGFRHAELNDDQLAITRWTCTVTGQLPQPEQLLAALLCDLEENDRIPWVLRDAWPKLWQHLDRPGTAPPWQTLVRSLEARALLTVERATEQNTFEVEVPPVQGSADSPGTAFTMTGQAAVEIYPGLVVGVHDDDEGVLCIRVHPTVAEAVRAVAEPEFPRTVSGCLAGLWMRLMSAEALNYPDRELTIMEAAAARHAIPYAARQGAWSEVHQLFEVLFSRDASPETVRGVLPWLRQAAEEADAAPVRSFCRRWIAKASGASSAPADDDHIPSGFPGEPGLSAPQPQMESETWLDDLQEAYEQGDFHRVLGHLTRLRDQSVLTPPADSSPRGREIRRLIESALEMGFRAAVGLREWQRALDLNNDLLDLMRQRMAVRAESVRVEFHNHAPLMALGRFDDARELLLRVRRTAEQGDDSKLLGMVMGSQAGLEYLQGHVEVAVRLQREALRHSTEAGDLHDLSIGHLNLGNMHVAADEPLQALCNHLIGAVIECVRGGVTTSDSVADQLAENLDKGRVMACPLDWPDVHRVAYEYIGIPLERSLPGLFTTEDPLLPQRTLDDLLRRAWRRLNLRFAPHLAAWDPVLSAIAAAVAGDDTARRQAHLALDDLREFPEWSPLVRILRGVLENRADVPDDNLKLLHHVIVYRLLHMPKTDVGIPPGLWVLQSMRHLLSRVVAAANGDAGAAAELQQALDELPAGGGEHDPLAGFLLRLACGDTAAQVMPRLDSFMESVVHWLDTHIDPAGPLPATAPS
ncbi:CHAT domain-containing protein [Streptomyces sp. NPDC059597]|uniref:tetratricopeptide repeat protein n=1 Tax=Streptomyces sp. NPDC059597 TaxID=3346879 RepID=UPI0036D09207